jgi:hypothetical protein
MPLGDWQFWVATVLALAAGAWLVWSLGFKRVVQRWRKHRVKATLTVGGKPVDSKRCH